VGSPTSSTVFPQELVVDYVRVYEEAPSDPQSPKMLAVVEAASGDSVVAPGGIATVFGENLALGVINATFDSSPGAFWRDVAGVSVIINGLLAPLTFVSPSQINFQVPWDTAPDGNARVEIGRGGGTLAASHSIDTARVVPRVFGSGGVALAAC